MQREVAGMLLPCGRRFVLRAHLLLLHGRPRARAWLHRHVVALPYAQPHREDSEDKHVRVSYWAT